VRNQKQQSEKVQTMKWKEQNSSLPFQNWVWRGLHDLVKSASLYKGLSFPERFTHVSQNDRVKNIKTPSQKPRKLRTNIWFKYFLEHGLFIRTVLVAKTDPVSDVVW